jgi:hypothetical protein
MTRKKSEIAGLSYGDKVLLLEKICGELLDLKVEYAEIAGKNATIRANLEVLKQVKSALQSAIKAEQNY